jgi:hypothetical protein
VHNAFFIVYFLSFVPTNGNDNNNNNNNTKTLLNECEYKASSLVGIRFLIELI